MRSSLALERRSSAPRARLFSANLIRCALCVLAWISALTAVSAVFGPAVMQTTHAVVSATQPRPASTDAGSAEGPTSEAERSAEGATDAVPDVAEDDALDLPAPSARQDGDLGRRVASPRAAIVAPGDPDRFVHTRPPTRA